MRRRNQFNYRLIGKLYRIYLDIRKVSWHKRMEGKGNGAAHQLVSVEENDQ